MVGRIAQVDREAGAPGDGRRHRHPSYRGLHHVLHVPNRQAEACDRLPVGDDVDVLTPGLPLGKRAAGARHLAEHALEGHADAFDLGQVLAEHLDPDRRPNPGRQHVDPRADRGRDRHLVAGHLQRGIHVARQCRQRARLLFRPDGSQTALHPVGCPHAVPARRVGRGPLVARAQRDDRLDHVELGRVSGRLRAACLPVHRRHLGKSHDDAILRGERTPGLLNRDPRKRGRHQEERALIERWHELRPQPLKHGHGDDHQQHRSGDDQDPEAHDQDRHRPVDRAQNPAHGIGRFGTEPTAQQEHHQRRCEGDRKNRGGEHGEGLRVGERREQFPCLAGQREDGQEADGDQHEREEDRPPDFLAGVHDDLLPIRLPGRGREPHVRVLDQHDHGIGQFANGDGNAAERHDVGRQPQVANADERQQDRER